jgi:hypothetical protein
VPSVGYRWNLVHFVNGQRKEGDKGREGKWVKYKDIKEIIPHEYQQTFPLVCYQVTAVRKDCLFKQNCRLLVKGLMHCGLLSDNTST